MAGGDFVGDDRAAEVDLASVGDVAGRGAGAGALRKVELGVAV